MNCASLLIHPSELSERWISRIAELDIPVLGIHPEGGKHADAYIEKMLSLLEDAKYLKLMDKACEKGLKLEYEMHAMRYLLPAREFDAHPEWFRMNAEGKRTTDYNLCPSCKEALDLVAENAAMLAKYPTLGRLIKNTHINYTGTQNASPFSLSALSPNPKWRFCSFIPIMLCQQQNVCVAMTLYFIHF